MTAQEHHRHHSHHLVRLNACRDFSRSKCVAQEEWGIFSLIVLLPTLLAYFSYMSSQTAYINGVDATLVKKASKKSM